MELGCNSVLLKVLASFLITWSIFSSLVNFVGFLEKKLLSCSPGRAHLFSLRATHALTHSLALLDLPGSRRLPHGKWQKGKSSEF